MSPATDEQWILDHPKPWRIAANGSVVSVVAANGWSVDWASVEGELNATPLPELQQRDDPVVWMLEYRGEVTHNLFTRETDAAERKAVMDQRHGESELRKIVPLYRAVPLSATRTPGVTAFSICKHCGADLDPIECAPVSTTGKVRFSYVMPAPGQADEAWRSGIAQIGDARLAWVNEGDIITMGELIEGKGTEPPALVSAKGTRP